ncbi:ribosomal protein S18-alanine N-acetyltransferase [uncultured Methanobrevibacter sp.]|uniref:ribosomal protein S18-alanine N-acetyltransferase n=1 Tax=uncultured Methanobrevibacter sp. TaxID=253161 RepID=UPI0025EC2EB9|nr:ribosomal protein S18-alanine N-acetyltransferase [uncultured Methanobrevibacter sp.]
MFIREFVPNDLARVYQIAVESFSDPYDIAILQQLFEIGAGFLVAVEDGDIVGYIIFWVKEEGLGHIITLAVDKKFRGQHIATRLLMMAVNIFRRCDIHRITLEVKSHNEIAVEFYRKFGFEIDRKVPKYYEDGSDAYVMFFNTEKYQN